MMQATYMTDCPESMLGQLSAWCGADNHAPENHFGAVVNGVALSPRVIEELRKLGRPLSWYTHGELEDAVMACTIDSQLIDDPDGKDFRDKLHLTPEEKHSKENKKSPRLHQTFVSRLETEDGDNGEKTLTP